jgi:hypothetical protein
MLKNQTVTSIALPIPPIALASIDSPKQPKSPVEIIEVALASPRNAATSIMIPSKPLNPPPPVVLSTGPRKRRNSMGEIPKKTIINPPEEEDITPLYSVRIIFDLDEDLASDYPSDTIPQKWGYILSNFAVQYSPVLNDMVQEKVDEIGLEDVLGEDLNVNYQIWSFHSHEDITFVCEYLEQLAKADKKKITDANETKLLSWFENALKSLGCMTDDFSKMIQVMELADVLGIDQLSDLLRATCSRMKRRQKR